MNIKAAITHARGDELKDERSSVGEMIARR